MKIKSILQFLVVLFLAACGPVTAVLPTETFTPVVNLPDLIISSVSLEIQGETGGHCVSTYGPYEVRITVQNLGSVPATNVSVLEVSTGTNMVIGELGALQVFQLNYPATSGNGAYNFAVDSENTVPESNEANNTYSFIAPTPTPPLICTPTITPVGATPIPQVSPNHVSIKPVVRSGVAGTCLLTERGQVFCWGQNFVQDFGVSPNDFGKPMRMENLQAMDLNVGWYHACAVGPGGSVSCWGQNTSGQLGDDSVQGSATPVTVKNLDNVRSVTAGAAHTCAVTAAGAVYCWGQNDAGQLGDGTMSDRLVPVPVTLEGEVTSLAAGSRFTCALLSQGQVDCWGDLTFLPANTAEERVHESPFPIPNLNQDVVEIAAGNFHLCVIKKSGEVLCEGMIVPPNDPPFSQTSSSTAGLTQRVQHLLAGTDFNCVLTVNGDVECWGDNYFGTLGDSTIGGSETPVRIELHGQTAIGIGGGYYTACALLSDGGVTCWGDTSFGQLGDGSARWK